MMHSIRFQFNEPKLVQALAYFSMRGIDDLTKLKAAKLLYFADKLHLNTYGRPITGDCYACMEYGPVPSLSLNEMNNALEKNPEIRAEEPAILQVLRTTEARYPVFVIKDQSSFDPDVFSASDLEVLDQIIKLHGHKTASQLIEESHREEAWLTPNQFRAPGSSVPIAFEQLFDRDNLATLEAVLQDQKDGDEFETSLRGSFLATA